MRFDDSLGTVLSGEMTTPFGAQSTWRQLVDLIARKRAPADNSTIARLAAIRGGVPVAIRRASARAAAFAEPPAALVRLFAEDEESVSAPVLRTAQLATEEWVAMLPTLTPVTRSVLRHRRDLPAAVVRALESFGTVDFVLAGTRTDDVIATPAPTDPPRADPLPAADKPTLIDQPSAALTAQALPPESTFVSISTVARGLPVVAEALRQSDAPPPSDPAPQPAPASGIAAASTAGTFPIADLVARIDAYQRRRETAPGPTDTEQPALFDLPSTEARSFRFETDASGVIRWVEGAARAPLIGLSLNLSTLPGGSQIDGVAAGAFRRRARFADARLIVGGTSDAAGPWRITGVPAFDRQSGRFSGYRGTARRPRADESAEPRPARNAGSDALRQLVHELRTPTNAIAGFAEMIETEMLGPVPGSYRSYAATIRNQADGLLQAIDDLDLAARLEAKALDLRPGMVPLAPLLARIADDLAPLARMRGAEVQIEAVGDLVVAADDRAAERLIARLMATLVASASAGERIGVTATLAGAAIALELDRPAALAAYQGDALLSIDAETEADREGAPLLGTGFALRLIRNLATELHGSLLIAADRLTLRLPAAVISNVEQASN